MAGTTSSQLINMASKMTRECHPQTTIAYSVYAPVGANPVFKTGARAGLIQERIRRKVPLGLLKAAKIGVIEVGWEIFQKSMKMVPVDTGELANSGRMSIGNTVYAEGVCRIIESEEWGMKSTVQTDAKLVRSKYRSLSDSSTDDRELVNQTSLNLFISFYREPKPDDKHKPENLALWVHETVEVNEGYGTDPENWGEDLNIGKNVVASRIGRGGQYITEPMQEYGGKLQSAVKSSIDAAIKLMDWDRL
jgi:hypothetical protein